MRKFKFWYLTRVPIGGVQGQSVQVKAMAEAFSRLAQEYASQENIDPKKAPIQTNKNRFIDFTLISTWHKTSDGNDKKLNFDNDKVLTNNKMLFKWKPLYAVGEVNKPSVKKPSKRPQLYFLTISFFMLLWHRPSVVYTRDVLVLFSCFCLHIKCAYELHNKPQNAINRFFVSYLKAKRLVFFVAISNVLKEYYVQDLGVEFDKILVCHDGVFIERYDQLRSTAKQSLRRNLKGLSNKKIANKWWVMYTGTLSVGKGGEYLKAIAEAPALQPTIVIHVGPIKGYAPAQASQQEHSSAEESWHHYFKENDNVYLLPATTDVNEIACYQMAADVLIFPTLPTLATAWCNSPLKLFEYMATGNIIVADKHSGAVLEVLTDHNALLVYFNDKKSLHNALLRAVKDSDLTKRLSTKALNMVRAKYTWQKRAKSIYHFLLS